MPSKLSIRVSKQNDIDHLVSQLPLFIAKAYFEPKNSPPLVGFVVKTVRFLFRN